MSRSLIVNFILFFLFISGNNARVIYCWYIARIFVLPIDITIYSYILKRVLTVVSSISLEWTYIWKNEFVILIFSKIFP